MAHIRLKEDRKQYEHPAYFPSAERLQELGFTIQQDEDKTYLLAHKVSQDGTVLNVQCNEFGFMTAFEGDESNPIIKFDGRIGSEREWLLLFWQIEWQHRHPDAPLPEGWDKKGTKDEIMWV